MPSIPTTLAEWAFEIAWAYRQAVLALPFTVRLRYPDAERDLYHLAPAACLRARGIARRAPLERATQAALRHHIDTFGAAEVPPPPPEYAFANAYLMAHHGLGLLEAGVVQEVLEFLGSEEGAALFRAQVAGSV